MQTFYVYITDLYGGDLNYNYITRLKVKANTIRGAICKVSRATGLKFRHQYAEIYHSTTKLTGLVIESEISEVDYLEELYKGAETL